jgi:hypothetical protein
MSRLGLCGLTLASLFLCLFAGRAVAVPFLITVDTGALQGSSGFIDLQFNPADAASPGALASIAGVAGHLDLVAAPLLEGNVAGTLPGPVQLSNSTVFNSYFQAARFGSMFRFVVDFSGDFLLQPSLFGTSFSVGLLNDALQPLLTNDVSGTLLRFELLAGNVSFEAFAVNGRAAATVTPVALPATGALFALGALLLLGGTLRRRC